MELDNNYKVINSGNPHLNYILTQRLIKLKTEYVKILCDCIYDDKLDDVITFKDYCENSELEEKFEWENNFKSICIEDDTAWF